MRGIGGILLAGVLLLTGCAGQEVVYRPGGEGPYPVEGKPKPGEIHHLPTGLTVSREGARKMISGATLVCVGETHDNIHAHRVEFEVIRDLFRTFPGRIAIGMEMFRTPQQEVLDRWTAGELSEREFLKAVKWYDNWGSDFGYYSEILRFAKENRIDIVALNPSKELQDAVTRSGLDNVPERLRQELPAVGPTDPYQYEAMKAVFGGHVHGEGNFESFFRIQMLWEETMAERVVHYLESPRGAGKKMVTLTGGWHVRYGFGLPKKVIRRMPVPYVIVLPTEIEIPPEMRDRIMDVDLPALPLLPGDFAWYVLYEGLEGKRVRMGIGLSEMEDRVVVRSVAEESPAAKAGVRPGDVFVSFDGVPVTDMTDILYPMEKKREGDSATLVLSRDGAETPVRLTFFRMTEKDPH